MNPEIRAALTGARAALVNSGFVGPGPHGSGDPEINAIDAALAASDDAERIASPDLEYQAALREELEVNRSRDAAQEKDNRDAAR